MNREDAKAAPLRVWKGLLAAGRAVQRERERPFTPDAGSEKVQRGGSFLCHPSYCHGYRVSARSHSTPDTALFHVGFRCVKGARS